MEVGSWPRRGLPTSPRRQAAAHEKGPSLSVSLGYCSLTPFHPSLSSPSPSPQLHTPRHRLQSGRQLNTWSFRSRRSLQFSCGRWQKATLHSPSALVHTKPFPGPEYSMAITQRQYAQTSWGQLLGDLIKGL